MKSSIAVVMRLPYQCSNISAILKRYGYSYPVLCIGADEEYAAEISSQLAEMGTRVVISGRHFPEKIAEMQHILITNFNRSRLTFRRSIELALRDFDRVAIVLRSGNYFDVASDVARAYGDRVCPYSFKYTSQIPGIIQDALSHQVKAFVGNASLIEYAIQQHVPYYDIPFEDDDVLNAVHAAEQNLRILEQQLAANAVMQTTWNSIPYGIVSLDCSGQITCINEEACILLKCKSIDLIGQSIEQTILHPLNATFYLQSGMNGSEIVDIQNIEVTATYRPILVDSKPQTLVISLEAVQQVQRMEEKIRRKRRYNGNVALTTFSDIIGNSSSLQLAKQDALRFAKTDSSILIRGETGTGKEMFAQSIHNASKRAEAPFVAVNCAALPENLLESILFGYERGAFTGANQSGQKGLFETAHTGTLFLDEIGEMSLPMQARMLRVLQEREFTPVGSTRVIPVDIRIIAATNRDLRKMVSEGTFRADLYYRLNVLSLVLPPLRSRPQDIQSLAEFFVLRNQRSLHSTATAISPAALQHLRTLPLEGNTRQLFNILERALILSEKNEIDEALIHRVCTLDSDGGFPLPQEASASDDPVQSAQVMQIREALAACNGSHKLAARKLGISDSTFYRRMRSLNIHD